MRQLDEPGETVTGVIDAITNPSDPYYKLSVFQPRLQPLRPPGVLAEDHLPAAAARVPGCTEYRTMFKTIAGWLNGDNSTTCSIPSGGGQGGNLQYIQSAISNYEMIYGKPWPYPMPM